MTAIARGVGRVGRGGRRVSSGVRRFWTGVTAVGLKDSRARMRGRRAFVVVTIYLILLAAFAFAIYHLVKLSQPVVGMPPPFDPEFGGEFGPGFGPFDGPVPFSPFSGGAALSAQIGHSIFTGLLLLETMLVLVLAPALTTGAISQEREKQTIDLLVTTPLSTLGMVVGKLFAALTYVFLLILASVPITAVVFAFGGVGPEDVLRGYVMLFAAAFGMGAIGLFISALARRTQTATVFTYIIVLALTIGTVALHGFWTAVAAAPTSSSSFQPRPVVQTQRPRAPEALLLLNPFVGAADVICGTASGFHPACAYLGVVTGQSYFGGSDPDAFRGPIGDGSGMICAPDGTCRGVPLDEFGGAPPGMPLDEPQRPAPEPSPAVAAGVPRDTFWPMSAAAFVVTGVALTVLSAQLVSPTRRLRMRRPRRPAFLRRRPRTAT